MSRMSHQNCFLRAKECQHKIVTGQSSCRAWQCCRPPKSASPRALWPTSLRQRGLDWNDENGFRGAVWIAALRDRFATECDQLWSFNAFMNIFWILVKTRAKVILIIESSMHSLPKCKDITYSRFHANTFPYRGCLDIRIPVPKEHKRHGQH